MDVSVQIVNYRTRAYLERCLESVLADLGDGSITHEVHLLDNASGEDLADLSRAHPPVSARVAPRNLGFGAGHNLLATETDADVLWILNPDVEIVEPGTARRLLAGLAADGVQAIGPRLLESDGAPQPYDHGRLDGPRAWVAQRGGHSYWRASARARRVAWVSGAAMMVRRAAFTAVGGFDERFFLFKEEEDLCLRLRAAGGEIRYEPSVSVRHVGSVVGHRTRGFEDSERLFIAKHCRPGAVQRTCAVLHQSLAYVHL